MNATWWVKPEQLDDDQRSVVALPVSGSYLVQGPPGSGKSNLLLLRAAYLARAGKPELQIVVFTHVLRDFLRSGASHYPFNSSRIVTLMGLLRRVLRHNGLELPEVIGDLSAKRRAHAEAVLDGLAQKRIAKQSQTILLDEAQDYYPEEVEVLGQLCDRLFAVADSYQQIYTHPSPIPKLNEFADKQVTLRFHYRNGPAICHAADEIGKAIPDYTRLYPTSMYDDEAFPSSVTLDDLPSIEAVARKLVERLRIQLKTYPDELLGIICPRNADVDALYDLLAASELGQHVTRQSSRHGYSPIDEASKVVIGTIHGFKGLEFRVCHVASVDSLERLMLARKAAYVATTRAKTALYFYAVGDAPGFIDAAVAAAGGPPPPVDFDALFKGGR